jgi:Leucine-rich repeat (LRR) protein
MKKILVLVLLALSVPVFCMDMEEKMDVEEAAQEEWLIPLPVPDGEKPRTVNLNDQDPITYETFSDIISSINLAIEKKEEQIPQLRLAEVVTTLDEKPVYHHFLSDSIDEYIKDQIINKHQARPENPLTRQPITRIYFYTYHPDDESLSRDELVLEPPFAIQEDAIVHQVAVGPEGLEHLLQELSPRAHADRYNQEQQALDLSMLNLYDENIPVDFFTSLAHILPNLQTLAIGRNHLESLPDNIGNLANLQTLGVGSNRLESLPDSIGNLVNLQTLGVSSNHLESLPDNIGNLANLQTLGVGHNRLESLPDSIENLVNLQTLGVSSNHLESLPDSIGNLANLQTLYLDDNQLNSLPESIGNLANLQTLYLDDNQLESLPDNIGNLANLQTLGVGYNRLESLPDNIGNLANLQTLRVNNNHLESLPDNIGNLANLQALGASNNHLESLPDNIGNLANLQDIYIGRNPNLIISPALLHTLEAQGTRVSR